MPNGGMRFDRRGLNQCTEAVEQGQVDAIIVKDLSRLGRHKTQTALLIDYLRQQGVAILSVTANLNTLLDEDDLIIGVRGLMNDYYAKDIGNKIRHGYREKQTVGLVITPPFGYWKDRNTNCIHQHPEAAETVRLIYDYYLQGIGQKEIARRLNRLGRKTPAQLRAETRNGKAKPVPAEHWQRHEGFYPAIITKEEWQQAQALLKQKARPAFENRAAHRYSGLLTCGNCGQPFVPMIRYWNGSRRVEYVCKGYHNHGKEFCSSHRIREECLDAQVVKFAEALRESWTKAQAELQRLYKQWSLRLPALDREIAGLQEEIRQNEEDIDELLMMRIQSAK